MANIASNGINLFESRITNNVVVVKQGNIQIETHPAAGPLMGDVIAVQNNTNNIGIVARIGSGSNEDNGYCCTVTNGTVSPWKHLGRTNQLQSIAWQDNKFLVARIGTAAEGQPLIVQNTDGTEISKTPTGGHSGGILYYDEIDSKFILTTGTPTKVGPYTLYRAVRRLLNGAAIYTGQKVGTPDILFTTNGSNIAFKSGPQPDYPQFIVVGNTLVVNGGVKYNPPYPTSTPVPPNPEPPDPEPPMSIPNNKETVVRNRAKFNDLAPGNRRGYEITNASAYDLRAEGAGTFFKNSGTNYNDRSIDIIIYKNRPGDPAGKGATFDVLGDAEGAANPQWLRTSPTGYGDVRNWREPVAPVEPEPGPEPGNPDRDMLISIRDQINEFLGE